MDLDFGDDGTLYVLEIDSDNILDASGSKEGGIWTVSRRGAKRKLSCPRERSRAGRDRRRAPRRALRVQPRARAGEGEVLRIDLD